jgi:hypothetical protein
MYLTPGTVVDERRDSIVYARNLAQWQLANDPTHRTIDPVQYFEQQLNEFAKRVLS